MNEGDSKIGNLDETLYSRTRYENPLDKRAVVRPKETPEVEGDWKGPELDEILRRERRDNGGAPLMKKFFIFSALFFVAALAIAGLVFFGGTNFISSKNVNLTVVGPTTASAGQVTELEVTIENGNNADLELANFSIQYPSGSRDPQDSSKQLTFSKESLGVIKAGDQVVRNVRFILIGQVGELKDLKFSVEYKVRGSKATFYKDKNYQVTIGNSPLSLTVTAPDGVDSGEVFSTVVNVTLNSTEVLKNVMLRAEYPYGFRSVESTPKAFSDNVWSLGDLSPGVNKKVEIRGSLVGENEDQRTMRFYVGSAEGENPSANFKNIIISAQKTVAVEKPAVDLKVTLNNDSSATYVAPAGLTLNASINYKNNLSQKLLNPRLEARITGAALDKATVAVNTDGFYDSSFDKVSWNIANIGGEGGLNPGEGGSASFRFASFADLLKIKGVKEINLEVTLSGTPLNSKSQIMVTEMRKVKIASQVTLGEKVLYSTGPFKNTGPIPPKAEATTTYSVMWSLGNTQNDITGGKVTAQLGPAVKWLSAYSESSEDITFDPKTNTVTWSVGTLVSGAGFSAPLREVAFQISLLPSISQVGTTPVLVNGILFSGIDSAGQKNMAVTGIPLNTQMPYDPQFIQGDGTVVR